MQAIIFICRGATLSCLALIQELPNAQEARASVETIQSRLLSLLNQLSSSLSRRVVCFARKIHVRAEIYIGLKIVLSDNQKLILRNVLENRPLGKSALEHL